MLDAGESREETDPFSFDWDDASNYTNVTASNWEPREERSRMISGPIDHSNFVAGDWSPFASRAVGTLFCFIVLFDLDMHNLTRCV
jgi:hypothetical protein